MRCLLSLVLCSVWVTSFASLKNDSIRRGLLQTKKELVEIEREENALESYHLQQATFNKEQVLGLFLKAERRTNLKYYGFKNMLHFGTEQATSLVRKFNKGNRKTQVNLFADLWENAEGVTVVKSLAMLIEITPKKRDFLFSIISESLDKAEDNGYGFKISDALYRAMAVRDSSKDHYLLLDALIYRMEEKNAEKKGTGCEYIGFLFSDAESWALDDGRAQQFFQGFDNTKYIALVECFLPACTGTAAKCCGDSKAVSTGMCGCKVINKKKGTKQCDHNLFWTAPRTIWLCGVPSCEPNAKCLCGKAGSSSKKPSQSKTTSKETKASSKETKASSKETKASSKETKASSKETKASSKKTKASSKETKASSKETKEPSKETKASSKETRESSKETKTKQERASKKSSDREKTKPTKRSKNNKNKPSKKT